jgi:hypothetical protein
VERPFLYQYRLVVERRSLRAALRALVETTEKPYAIGPETKLAHMSGSLPLARP